MTAIEKRRAKLLRNESGAPGTRMSAANAGRAKAEEEAEIARLEAILNEYDEARLQRPVS